MSNLWLPDAAKPTPEKPFKWNYACPQTWDSLQATTQANVKFCTQCKETVHYVTSFSNFLESVEKGRCIAVDASEDFKNLYAAHRQDAEGPCVVKKREREERTNYLMPERMGRVDVSKTTSEAEIRRLGRFVRRPDKAEEREEKGE